MLLAVPLAGAEARRFALIVGNQSYTAVSALDNPVNDARSLEQALTPLGFDVRAHTDLSLDRMRGVVEEWAAALPPNSLALYYYAGHGVQIDGTNYLIPVDFKERTESAARTGALSVDWIREKLEASPAVLRLIVLDACRNNPFRSRGGDNALAGMNTAAGTFIALSTGPGMQAADGGDRRNGLFTGYLVEGLRSDGVELMDLFNQVRERVVRATEWRQVPRVDSGVVGKFYFRAPPGWVDPRFQPRRNVEAEADARRRRAATRDRQLTNAREQLKAGNQTAALEHLRHAHEADPEAVEVLGLAAQTEAGLGQWEAAATTAAKALALAPQSAELHRLRGHALFEAAQYKEAIEALTRALELAPDARTYWLRSSARIRTGDLAGAEADRRAQRELTRSAPTTAAPTAKGR